MNDIKVLKRRTKLRKLRDKYPEYKIIDLTSKSNDPGMRKFSPFYPHGNIPVPYSKYHACSVEGIWQGLKVFEKRDGTIEEIDTKCFSNATGKNLKRTLRAKNRLKCLGHRVLNANALLGYSEARKKIYLPSYRFVLKNSLRDQVSYLGRLAETHPMIFLDYNTNEDNNLSQPLSHAGLVKQHLLDSAKVYYFSYGSNMNKKQMENRCGHAVDGKLASLKKYSFVYDGYSERRKGAVANIIQGSDDKYVFGVLYQVTEADIKKLDKAEGYPACYRREKLEVACGEELKTAWVYLRDPQVAGRPNENYLRTVLNGAEDFGLPKKYIEKYINRHF